MKIVIVYENDGREKIRHYRTKFWCDVWILYWDYNGWIIKDMTEI
jgi:hypothetical protein